MDERKQTWFENPLKLYRLQKLSSGQPEIRQSSETGEGEDETAEVVADGLRGTHCPSVPMPPASGF